MHMWGKKGVDWNSTKKLLKEFDIPFTIYDF